jgi:hypothetical protein
MKILIHHIYEYKKGLRNLVLRTLPRELLDAAIERLELQNIPYLVRPVNDKKVNIFFGKKECVDIIAGFGDKPLNQFSDEEDFILGIMLGYCRHEQCKRYMRRKQARRRKMCRLEDEQVN